MIKLNFYFFQVFRVDDFGLSSAPDFFTLRSPRHYPLRSRFDTAPFSLRSFRSIGSAPSLSSAPINETNRLGRKEEILDKIFHSATVVSCLTIRSVKSTPLLFYMSCE